MKLICAQSDLSSHLSLVSRAVPSRPTHPVLANVLLTADADTQRVQLTGFDLSLGIRTSFPATVITEGTITLPAKLLNDIISRLADGEITLDDESAAVGKIAGPEVGMVATITSSSGRYQVRAMGAEEYPELPVIEDESSVKLPASKLIEGLRGCLFATSADETKQILTGVHLKVQKDGLEFAATDGHRLAVLETSKQDSSEEEGEVEEVQEFSVTVPARALRELERMLAQRQGSESVGLYFDQGQIVFEWGDQRLTSRKLEGQYPNYRQLLPRSFGNQINLDRKGFVGALERIAVLADQKNHIVKCSINQENQEIYLSVEAADVGSGRESLSAQISSDEPPEIAFNVKYLLEGLKVMGASDISIKLNDPMKPVVVMPLGEVKMTYLVMPVQLRS